jgi:glycosyltransferase involved in cell wall biosynthesis
MHANYITNLSLSEISGGWSGFNAAMYASLSRHYSMKYVGPISPPESVVAKIDSKARRAAGLPGSFQYFAKRRLDRIAQEISNRAPKDAMLDFFHGSTPWVAYTPRVPYACYLDVCFSTYMSIYHDRTQFSSADVSRIERREAAWLRDASCVFFSSRWAMREASLAYDIDDSTMAVAGLGGHIPIPAADTYAGGREFLFMALDFVGKGGEICVEAFRRVRRDVPDVTLRLVGERPPATVLDTAGVSYEGALSKSKPADLRRLRKIFSSAFALIHPTSKDATPQVIVEAQYHGCPVIAPNSFGIPEMVANGITGFLVSSPPNAIEVAERMVWLCEHPNEYARMRAESRVRSLELFTWEQVGNRIAKELVPVLS